MRSPLTIRKRIRRLESAFGPADPDEVLNLIGREALDLIGRNEVDTLVARLEEVLEQYPLSHNLRVMTIKVYRLVGRLEDRDRLLSKSLAMYPESPVLLRQVLDATGASLSEAERRAAKAREDSLFREAGLPRRGT